MKILITADLHITKGIKTDVGFNFLDYIHSYYLENNLNYLFVLGDIFEKASNIKNESFIPLFKKLLDMKKDGINFIFLLGNHDIINVDNDSIVETFEPIGKVIKKYEEIHFPNEDNAFGFLPYTKKEEDITNIRKDLRYLFTHIPIADFTFDNAYHATEKHAFKKALFEDFQFVFTGHFHRHQSYKNIVYPGSPFQHNRGERGQEKGFIIFDTKIESYEFIKYDKAPTYLQISIEDIPNLNNFDFNNKYVTVKIDKRIKDFAKLKYILYERGALDIQPIFETVEEEVEINEEIEVNHNIEDIAKEFVLGAKNEKINNEKLSKIFEKVLKEV